MLTLTKLDGSPTVLNPDHIERVESHPDTVIHLTYGAHLVVHESVEEVVEGILEAKAEVLRRAMYAPGAPGRAGPPQGARPLRVLGPDGLRVLGPDEGDQQ